MKEHELQNQIRLALAPEAVILRVNAGKLWAGTPIWDERRQERILTNIYPVAGVPKGTADLIGFRRSDGKFVAIEVKTKTGRLSNEQKRFLDVVRECGGIAGVARSVEEALNIVNESTVFELPDKTCRLPRKVP